MLFTPPRKPMPSPRPDPFENQSVRRNLLDVLPVGILVLDAEGRVRFANGAARHILGQSREDMAAPDWVNPLAAAVREDGEPFGASGWPLPRVLEDGCPIRDLEMGILRDDDSWVWLMVNADPASLGEEESRGGVVLSFSNNTLRRREQRMLQTQLFQDLLTELPNRMLFNDRLGQALTRMERNSKPIAVLLLDLNKFKVINDTLSHVTGDLLLVAVAGRLKRCMRRTDTLARPGGTSSPCSSRNWPRWPTPSW